MRKKALDIIFGHDPELRQQALNEINEYKGGLIEDDEEWVSAKRASESTDFSVRQIRSFARSGKWRSYKGFVRPGTPSGVWFVVIPREFRTKKRGPVKFDHVKETYGLCECLGVRWPYEVYGVAKLLGWYSASGSALPHAQAVDRVIKNERFSARVCGLSSLNDRLDERTLFLLKAINLQLLSRVLASDKSGVRLRYINPAPKRHSGKFRPSANANASWINIVFFKTKKKTSFDDLLSIEVSDFLLPSETLEGVKARFNS